MAADPPGNEEERLRALLRYRVLDTDPEQAFDDIAFLAAQICGTPIALISLVDADRQWFKARVGLEASETPRSLAFCAHAIRQPDELLVVPDATNDARFATNPLVAHDPKIRFYAGAPLVTREQLPLGTICVIDRVPRQLGETEQQALRALSRQVMAQLELRRTVRSLQRQKARLEATRHELERSNQELDDFAYIVSHDLKEPLRGLRNYSQFLLEDHADALDAEGSAKLETLVRLSGRMGGLLDSLLEYSRVGRIDLAHAETALGEVLEEVVDSLHIGLEEKGVEVRVPRPLPHLECDRVRVAEIFRNLISNATKYNDKPHPWIEIGWEQDPAGASATVFYVRDNGIGIPEKHHQRVFDMFRRLHKRDAFGGGTGVGLSIVKKLVERHGGRIWLESAAGEGSTFKFTLPGKRAGVA